MTTPARPVPVIDEVTAVDGAAKGHLAAILEQLAKFGVRLHAMTQMAQRLTPATRDALLQNQSLLSSTAGDVDAVKLIARQRAGQVEPATIASLPRFHHVVSATVGGETTSPFKVRGALVTELFAGRLCPGRLGVQRAAINANLRRRRIGDVLADLESLDDRILGTSARHPTPTSPRRSRPGPAGPDAATATPQAWARTLASKSSERHAEPAGDDGTAVPVPAPADEHRPAAHAADPRRP
ncbi:MAG TPA: hypothetical protein VN969_28215 [Streptosporangiaceae bacterium]|nr:hypothetical protein [Streptosporangiaceae bacterium]